MGEGKTKPTQVSVEDYIAAVEPAAQEFAVPRVLQPNAAVIPIERDEAAR